MCAYPVSSVESREHDGQSAALTATGPLTRQAQVSPPAPNPSQPERSIADHAHCPRRPATSDHHSSPRTPHSGFYNAHTHCHSHTHTPIPAAVPLSGSPSPVTHHRPTLNPGLPVTTGAHPPPTLSLVDHRVARHPLTNKPCHLGSGGHRSRNPESQTQKPRRPIPHTQDPDPYTAAGVQDLRPVSTSSPRAALLLFYCPPMFDLSSLSAHGPSPSHIFPPHFIYLPVCCTSSQGVPRRSLL